MTRACQTRLAVEDVKALDHLVVVRTVATGKPTTRSHLIREAVERMLRDMAPTDPKVA
jgi:hypothetical protein